MSVVVISKRIFNINKPEKLIPLLKNLREHAKKQKGFVSRKTYSSVTNPGEFITISKWKTKEHFEAWQKQQVTRELQYDVDSIIGEKTVYEVYQPESF